jgi:flagellar motor protein MotB
MTVEENRKKVRRNNLLVSLLFLVMIAGVAGAVYYYSNLKKGKAIVKEQKDELEKIKNDLALSNKKLESYADFMDSISKVKIKLDSISWANNPQSEILRQQINLNKLIHPVIKSRDSARKYTRDGYDKLNKNDLKGAMIEFEKSEKFYKGFHESNQIHQLLKENENKLSDKEVQQQILIKIKQDYNSLQRLKQPE